MRCPTAAEIPETPNSAASQLGRGLLFTRRQPQPFAFRSGKYVPLGLPQRRRRSGQDEGGAVLAGLQHRIKAGQHSRWEADDGTVGETLRHEKNKS